MSLSETIMNVYRPLTAFLGQVLSDDYHIGLYQVNGTAAQTAYIPLYQTGPITLDDASLAKAVETAKELPFDYLCGFTDRGKMPAIEKAAVYPIRDESGEMTGFILLLKNFSEKVDLKEVVENIIMSEDAANAAKESGMNDRIRQVLVEKTQEIYARYQQKGRLKKTDKVDLMRDLFEAGITKMRGGMQIIAEVTGISSASLYRYLMEVIEE